MTKQLLAAVITVLALSLTGVTLADSAALSLSKSLTPHVSVTGQMNTEKFTQLMQQGFKSVIVNRPDQEQGNLVTVNQLRSIAEDADVSVIYQPVVSGKISATDVVEFAKYYNELPKPILMVCRSGTRSKVLFDQAKAQGLLHE
ncbi:sulfur transferase domain-containing protein [uncultured Acinetobacter sp.]|uniref:beta-lactamase hydrolase domain-containing protein n=1 Tax=uncultured Acinetobacter sp. TaxID=165433 RepID=UPI0026024378|nr:sulfur transferase domain-containing protein [uncultured Acinetobacter sp.]